jgi:hypothetical protein
MTVYAHIENNEITGVYDLLPENWRNISNFHALATDPELLNQLGWRTIVRDEPVYDPQSQYLGFPKYELVDGEVHETIPVLDSGTVEVQSQPIVYEQLQESNPETIIVLHNMAMSMLRTKCKQLLEETDYTQLADVIALNGSELTQEYVTYRQQLRDLPNTYENDSSFINETDVQYPSLPGVV